ncbi:hypothetical protein SCUP234_12968 [Seiridium cupressi]
MPRLWHLDTFLSQLNLTEKAALVTGNIAGACDGNINPIPRLDFSGLCLHIGPAAIRVADLASLFPAGVTAGPTWDKDLMYARGLVMGEEFRGKGAHIALAPVAALLGRHPLGGRKWEGFGADPYLADLDLHLREDESLNKILKNELGFQGYVIGLDMTMPETMDQTTAESLAQSAPYEEVPSHFGGNLTAAVTNETLAETRGNGMIHRILAP